MFLFGKMATSYVIGLHFISLRRSVSPTVIEDATGRNNAAYCAQPEVKKKKNVPSLLALSHSAFSRHVN